MARWSSEVTEGPGKQLCGVGEQADESKCEGFRSFNTGRNSIGKVVLSLIASGSISETGNPIPLSLKSVGGSTPGVPRSEYQCQSI